MKRTKQKNSNNKVILITIIALCVLIIVPLIVKFVAYKQSSTHMQPNNISFKNGTFSRIADFQKSQHPDVFLTNKLPYQSSTYTVASSFMPGSPSGHFRVTVMLKNAQGKEDFLNWLHSLGFSHSQIQTLDIIYQ